MIRGTYFSWTVLTNSPEGPTIVIGQRVEPQGNLGISVFVGWNQLRGVQRGDLRFGAPSTRSHGGDVSLFRRARLGRFEAKPRDHAWGGLHICLADLVDPEAGEGQCAVVGVFLGGGRHRVERRSRRRRGRRAGGSGPGIACRRGWGRGLGSACSGAGLRGRGVARSARRQRSRAYRGSRPYRQVTRSLANRGHGIPPRNPGRGDGITARPTHTAASCSLALHRSQLAPTVHSPPAVSGLAR